MAEVEKNNTSENVGNLNVKMNGVNGLCDDEEPMDVDLQNVDQQSKRKSASSSPPSSEISAKKLDNSNQLIAADVMSKKCTDNPIVADQCSRSSNSSSSSSSSSSNSSSATGESSERRNSKKNEEKSNQSNGDESHTDGFSKKTNKEKLSSDRESSVKDPLKNKFDQKNQMDEKKKNSSETQDTKRADNSKVEKTNEPEIINGDSVDDNDVEHVPIIQEVHSISDSDDDEVEDVSKLKTNKSIISKSIQQNGHNDGDDDTPVSIHSDSEPEIQTKSVNNADEVHEILSDKEDCVLVEDDGKKDEAEIISPRRSTRARKSVVKVRDFSAFDDDIEEVVEDPLMQPAAKKPKTLITTPPSSSGPPPLGITIQDARSLATDPLMTTTNNTFQQQFLQSQQNNKKEPTLVIIDTNQIIQRGVSGVSAGAGIGTNSQCGPNYSLNMRTSITPVQKSPQSIGGAAIKIGLNNQTTTTPLLPALMDDMFVLEAPSFIVPYIYEKPPSDNLKEIVEKIGKELDEQKKKEQTDDTKDKETMDSATDPLAKDLSKNNMPSDQQQQSTGPVKDDKKKKKKRAKDGDDSWDESDTSTDDEASDTEQRTKVLIKEVKDDLDVIKPHIISIDSLKNSGVQSGTAAIGAGKKDNYFERPLGLFFIDIGINLVQEHVQTDLLRQQKKKLQREGDVASSNIQLAINSLMKNLELSKVKNNGFKFEMKRCEYCNFKSESVLAMAHHYETPHMHNQQYKCNFCSFETRPPYDILFHMEAVHNIKARLEKAQSYHQCPNCPFEDNGKSKLARHTVICQKKFRPDLNLNPPVDWEPPAKIPRIKPRHGLVGTATAYQAMAAQAQRAASGVTNVIQRQNVNVVNTAAMMRGRGRPQTVTKTSPAGTVLRTNQNPIRAQIPGMILPNNFQLNSAGQYIQVSGTGLTMLSNVNKALNIQSSGPKIGTAKTQQPSISITPLPRHGVTNTMQQSTTSMSSSTTTGGSKPGGGGSGGMSNLKPGQQTTSSGGGKTAFVICEICDGYIKDLDQLRNHMQWMHKVKIHPKMIYNRPPLNCQKCQFRFFTDQGLERHLLGSHGLVTSSMQEAANKGKDAGRCPVCGRMYQWKLLNHVSRDHNMTLKPAHLSYKCTVCTATFGMYKQFENHVYSAHSTVAKKAMDNKKAGPSPSGGSGGSNSNNSNISKSNNSGDSLLKPLKINDEITIIPQPISRQSRGPMEIESHIID